MARLTPVDPSTATGVVKEIFEGPLKGKHFNIFKSMAQSPAALNFYLAASGALGKSGLNAKEQEVIQLVTAQANACDYCLSAHTAIGKMVGLSDAQTLEARRGHVNDAKLGALAKFAAALHEKRGHVTDADVQAFKAGGYTDANIAEVIAVYATAVFTNYFNHVNQTPVDFPAIAKI